MKRIITSVLLSFLIFMTAVPANASLFEFYREYDQPLPSVDARAPLYNKAIAGDVYSGTSDQNNRLEDYLRSQQSGTDSFGGVKPFRPSGYSSTISSSLAEEGSETELTVNSITLPDDTTLASTTYGDLLILTVGEGESEEKIAVSSLNVSTLTFTIVTRGLAYGSYTEVDDNKHRHLPGERIYVSDDDHFMNQQYVSLDSTETIAEQWTFTASPIVPTPASSDTTYAASVGYVNDVATSGVAVASKTISGRSEHSTAREMASSTATGSTGSGLVITAEASGVSAVETSETLDSYADSYIDNSSQSLSQGQALLRGQSFMASSSYLSTATFYLKVALGAPTGNMYSRLYAHTGTFGSSGKGTGSALASSTLIDVSTITSNYVAYTFTFPTGQQYEMTAGTPYVITVEWVGSGVGKQIAVGMDVTSPVHSGNASYKTSGGSWAAVTYDQPFVVIATTKHTNVVTELDGKISQDFVDFTEDMSFTGELTGAGIVGEVIAYASSSVPTGWLSCNGQSVSSTTYSRLLGVIGTTFGSGSNTFKVPDLRGRFITMASTTQSEFDNFGETGGATSTILTEDQMPSHTHGDVWSEGGSDVITKSGTPLITFDGTSASTGGDEAHSNLDPYIVLQYLIKY